MFGLLAFLLLGIGFGIVVYYTNPQPISGTGNALYGWNISVSLAQLILFVAPILKVLKHHKQGLMQLIQLILSLALGITYSIIYYVLGSASDLIASGSIYYLLFFMFYYPGLVLLYYGYNYFTDLNYVIDMKGIVSVALSAVFNFAGGGVAVWGLGGIPGAALLGIAAYIYTGLGVYSYYKKTGQFPLILKTVLAILISATFIAIVVVSFVVPTSTSFFGFSVAYLIVSFALIAVCGGIMYTWGESQLFYSPVILPVYYLDQATNTLVHKSLVPFLFLVGLSMLVIYGGIATCFIIPAQVGVATSVIAEILAIFVFVFLTTKRMYDSGKSVNQLTPEVLTKAW